MSKYKIKKQPKKFKKLKKLINNLKINSEEMSEEFCYMIAETRSWEEEIQYMQDFIRWKNLDDDYAVFKRKTHEDTDTDMPFRILLCRE